MALHDRFPSTRSAGVTNFFLFYLSACKRNIRVRDSNCGLPERGVEINPCDNHRCPTVLQSFTFYIFSHLRSAYQFKKIHCLQYVNGSLNFLPDLRESHNIEYFSHPPIFWHRHTIFHFYPKIGILNTIEMPKFVNDFDPCCCFKFPPFESQHFTLTPNSLPVCFVTQNKKLSIFSSDREKNWCIDVSQVISFFEKLLSVSLGESSFF